jgi:molecular chaperone GrpE
MALENIDEFQKKAEKFELQYNKLRQEFKEYLEISKKNEEKKRLEIRSDISKRLLVVADSLTRLTGFENSGSCDLIQDYTDNIRKNIDTVYIQLLSASGLTPIEPRAGDKFDEQKYIAIGLEYTAKYPDNSVFKVVRKGYFIENTIVRPAEVIISKNSTPQKGMKEAFWNRLVRIIKPEKINLSELKRDLDELNRKQRENIERISLDIESIKNSIHELDAKAKQKNELENLDKERIDKMK